MHCPQLGRPEPQALLFPCSPLFEIGERSFGEFELVSVDDVLVITLEGRNGDVEHFMVHDPLDGKARNVRTVVGPGN